MSFDPSEYLPIGIRGYTGERISAGLKDDTAYELNRVLFFDRETTTTEAQRDRIGFARERYLNRSESREYCVYADDLPVKEPDSYALVLKFCEHYKIKVISQGDFAKTFLRAYYNSSDSAIVGFNLAFDISRIAYDVFPSRTLHDGFTFRVFPPRPACTDDCKTVHRHIKPTCKLVPVNFDDDGKPILACQEVMRLSLKGISPVNHDCILPPCPDDCKNRHHTSRCYKACKEKHEHQYDCRFACEQRHKHIQAYCVPGCDKHHNNNCLSGCKDHSGRHRWPPCSDDCQQVHEHYEREYFSDLDPAIQVKHLGPHKKQIQWRLISSTEGDKSKKRSGRTGQFIDLSQLIFAMTDSKPTLRDACIMYGVDEGKGEVDSYDEITWELLEYARRDTRITERLFGKVNPEYKRRYLNTTGVPPTAMYSPASLGKANASAFGITPMLDRGDRVPNENDLMGICTSTFYGALADAHIRRAPMPVAVNDFTNMYGTVNVLMGLWDYHTAARITTDESVSELSRFTNLVAEVAEHGTKPLLDQGIWKTFVGFAQVIPRGDVLPVRAQYRDGVYNVGHNTLWSREPLWFTYADILASALLTGKAPQILRVIRFNASTKKLAGLQPVNFAGICEIDPRTQDLFKFAIEERGAIKARMSEIKAGKPDTYKTDPVYVELDRNQKSLKTSGVNSFAYGQNVEMRAEYEEKPTEITVWSYRDESWQATPTAVEKAGRYCYPPIGAVITGAARLMLVILERLIADAGGSWVFRDTDSMAIVTTKDGGLISCNGGPYKMPGGRQAVNALSRAEVRHIRDTINLLNPYDRIKISELLKDETEKVNTNGQVWAFAISAKRYCLFFYDQDGNPVIPADTFDENGNFKRPADIDDKAAYMQHGLGGHYMNPDDLNWETKPHGKDNGHWIRQYWQWILDRAHGITRDYPDFIDHPAIGKYAVTTPSLYKSFDRWNAGKPYADQVKPFGFLLLVTEHRSIFADFDTDDEDEMADLLVEETERAERHGKERRLLAPFSKDPNQWLTGDWYDLNNPNAEPVKISTKLSRGKVPVRSHRLILDEYEFHPEIKSATPDGKVCTRRYSGLLFRRTVRVARIDVIGKESNRIEEVKAGMVTDADDYLTFYPHTDRTIAKAAFGGMPTRQIAELVNSEETAFAKRAKRDGYRSDPVTVDNKQIWRYFNGNNIRDLRLEAAIVRTAAKRIAPTLGIKPNRIGYANGQIKPWLILGMWYQEDSPMLETDSTEDFGDFTLTATATEAEPIALVAATVKPDKYRTPKRNGNNVWVSEEHRCGQCKRYCSPDFLVNDVCGYCRNDTVAYSRLCPENSPIGYDCYETFTLQ